MAKISKSDAAPKEAVHFVFGVTEFDLEGADSTFETDDASVLASAAGHPWLNVAIDAPAIDPTAREDYDPNDPHDNPSADHLSVYASDSAVKAAAANETAIREAVGIDDVSVSGAPDSENPSASESIEETFNSSGVVVPPQFAETPTPEPAPAEPVVPTPSLTSTDDEEVID